MKEELAKVKREVKSTMENYKASSDFVTEKAQAVVAFQSSKEFSNYCITFN